MSFLTAASDRSSSGSGVSGVSGVSFSGRLVLLLDRLLLVLRGGLRPWCATVLLAIKPLLQRLPLRLKGNDTHLTRALNRGPPDTSRHWSSTPAPAPGFSGRPPVASSTRIIAPECRRSSLKLRLTLSATVELDVPSFQGRPGLDRRFMSITSLRRPARRGAKASISASVPSRAERRAFTSRNQE